MPTEQAVLKIPSDSLRKLPEGAEYHAQSGRAGATVKTKGDTLIIYATCDSLQRLVEYYERRAEKAEADYGHLQHNVQTEEKRRANPVKIAFVCFGAGMAAGIITVTTIQKRRRNGK